MTALLIDMNFRHASRLVDIQKELGGSIGGTGVGGGRKQKSRREVL